VADAHTSVTATGQAPEVIVSGLPSIFRGVTRVDHVSISREDGLRSSVRVGVKTKGRMLHRVKVKIKVKD
jgi:hypothetical protein